MNPSESYFWIREFNKQSVYKNRVERGTHLGFQCTGVSNRKWMLSTFLLPLQHDTHYQGPESHRTRGRRLPDTFVTFHSEKTIPPAQRASGKEAGKWINFILLSLSNFKQVHLTQLHRRGKRDPIYMVHV